MKSLLLLSVSIVLFAGGCSSTYEHSRRMTIVFVDDLNVDGIELHDPQCTAEFVQSVLGSPARIDLDGRMLRYTEHGIDLLFSRDSGLSEIHLNRGFKGKLNSGISMSSSKQEVFKAYGKPLDEINASSLSRKNDERILYRKGNTSRIYYGDHGLIFWFRNDTISQIVPFEGKMIRRSLKAGELI
ncbi:MAG: hypothetical protein KAS23_17355 [Anaerohalosphaera sp.]|nr:hypothetical protein [Anaerohalosphaera sp.]